MMEVHGVAIEQGVSDWQIFQQQTDSTADIAVAGRWGGGQGVVELRLVREDDSQLVASHLNWQEAETRADGTWSAILKDVPAGGLYRLETHLRTDPYGPAEWQMHGDMRHFLGVGDLWVIAGQSNAAGYGRGGAWDPPELGIHLFNNAMCWTLASQPLNETTGTVHPENREGANSGHGPWLHFARLIKRELNFPVGLVQVSLGGSAFVSWNPTEPGEHPLYDLMMRIHQAVGGHIRGILWYQGESETEPDHTTDTYEDRFVAGVTAWRAAMGQPNLPVLTVQLGHWTGPARDGSDERWTRVREAQRRVPKRLPGVTVSPTLDLTLTDGIHVSPASNMVLAQRMANAALATVYGRNVHYLAPEPVEARSAADGSSIVLRFDNVVGQLGTIAPEAAPFRVVDEQGVVEIQSVGMWADRVRLQLARSLVGVARVHGGYGIHPAVVPTDMDRVMPMLGFYNLPVE